jgi:Zn-dependent peptidase ImmA (M78 family)
VTATIGRELATDALVKALKLRSRLKVPLTLPICPVDAAENVGLEIRFVDLPSMEGIYTNSDTPTILISSLRPYGRQMFTCAHELGHHIYGHGDQFDGLEIPAEAGRRYDPKEFAADCFASFFLMPKSAIDSAIKSRGLTYQLLGPIDLYRLASYFGVGYQTIISHMAQGLRVITQAHALTLERATPKEIRAKLVPDATTTNLYVVDHAWRGRAIDCSVGDYLLTPTEAVSEGMCLNWTRPGLAIARQPGLGRVIVGSDWAGFVRVSRANYTGRSCFRFDEEVPE